MYERQVELFKKKDFLYIYLDEGGNFDFSANGTKYFTLTSVTTVRPFIIRYKCDHPDYPIGKAPWAFIIGVEPFSLFVYYVIQFIVFVNKIIG